MLDIDLSYLLDLILIINIDLNGERITSCWDLNKNGISSVKKSKKKEWQERLINLKSQIDYWINEDNKSHKTIEIIQLYFDK